MTQNPERVYVVRWRSRSGPKQKTYLRREAVEAFVLSLAEWDTRDVRVWAAPCGPWAEVPVEDES